MRDSSTSSKRERLEARVTAEQKELFQRAADLTGRSLTDFIVSSVQAAAEEAIRTRQVLQLTARETEAFVEAFLSPREPNEALRKYARRHEEMVDRE